MPKKQKQIHLIKFPKNNKFQNNSPYILKLKTGDTIYASTKTTRLKASKFVNVLNAFSKMINSKGV
jgi:hypothetical protein